MMQFPKVSCAYGSPVGRSQSPFLDGHKVRVYRVRIDSGGYDDGGAYWGLGSPLFCAEDGEGFRQFIRAGDRRSAQVMLRERFEGIVFARTER